LDKRNKEIILDLSVVICRSKNFSPRIIEFFTSDLVKDFNPNEYEKFIKENLAKPKKIWQHAYLNQISDYDRFLLNTLYSLGSNTNKIDLEYHYNFRLDFEVKNNNFKKPIDSFNKSLRVLKDGFLLIDNYGNEVNISFINHSLEDFLNYFICENNLEKERILSASILIEQWFKVFNNYAKNRIIEKKFSEIFLLNYKKYLKNDKAYFLSSIFIFSFIDKKSNIINDLLKSIKNWSFIKERSAYTSFHLNNFIKNASNVKVLNKTISNFSNSFFLNYINDFEILNDIIDRVQLLKKHYNFSFRDYIKKNISSSFYRNEIKDFLETLYNLYDNCANDEVKFLNSVKDIQSINDSEYFLNKNKNFIIENIDENFDYNLSLIFDKNWDEIIKNNIIENVKDYKKENYGDEDFEEMIDNTYQYEEYDSIEFDLNNYYKENLKLPELSNIISEEFYKKPGLDDFTNFEPGDLPF
jgi:hypothetical protein